MQKPYIYLAVTLQLRSVSVVVKPGTMSGLADETRWMDATEQAALVSKGEVTPSELLEAAIETGAVLTGDSSRNSVRNG